MVDQLGQGFFIDSVELIDSVIVFTLLSSTDSCPGFFFRFPLSLSLSLSVILDVSYHVYLVSLEMIEWDDNVIDEMHLQL